MTTICLSAAALLVLTAAGFVLLFRRLLSPTRHSGFSQDWLTHFSVNRYRPMERLLADEDYLFLSSQKGDTSWRTAIP